MAMVNTALTDTVTLEEDPAGRLGGGDNVNKSVISYIWKHSNSCSEMTQAPFTYTRPSGVETKLTKPVLTPFYVRLHLSS